MVKKLNEEYLPDHIAKFECRAAANSAEEGWIFGNKVPVYITIKEKPFLKKYA